VANYTAFFMDSVIVFWLQKNESMALKMESVFFIFIFLSSLPKEYKRIKKRKWELREKEYTIGKLV
jgi:hypothetical protein